jgi:hypothetical protein
MQNIQSPPRAAKAATGTTNLKVLPKDTELADVYKTMSGIQRDLGVQCGFCHEEDPDTKQINLNTWPATIFVGRDGLVKGVHPGFASPASGAFNDQLKAEFTAKIEKLLAENATRTTSASVQKAPTQEGGE